jgi:O-antigen/teichoic acid export membrane protein
MEGRLLKNLAAYSVADILGKSILLLLSPILTRQLTHFQYGAIPLLTACWAILSVAQFGGFDFAFQMFRVQTTDEREREKIRITASIMAAAWLFLFWLVIVGFAMGTDLVVNFAQVDRSELIFYLLAIIPASLAYWSIYVFRFLHLAMPYVRINLLSKVASVVIAIPFIIMAEQENRLMVMFAVIFVCQTATLIWVYKEYKTFNIHFHLTYFSKDLAVKMFKFGAAFIPSTVIYASTIYVDRMIMGLYSTVDQVAILGLAVTLSAGILMMKSWFSMVWDPQLLEWLATKNPAFYLPKLQRAIPAITLAFLSLTILAELWSGEIIRFVYPEHFAEVADLIPFFVLAGGASVLTLVAISTAIIKNTSRLRLQIYSGALASNIVVAIIFIPRLGLTGAALGTLLGEIFILISWIIIGKYAWKNLNLNWSFSIVAITLTFLFILFYEPGYLTSSLLERVGLTVFLLLAAGWAIRKSKLFDFITLRQKVNT